MPRASKQSAQQLPKVGIWNDPSRPTDENTRVMWQPVRCALHHFEKETCKCPPGPQYRVLLSTAREILFGGARGGSKLSPVDSQVLTPKGYVRLGDLIVGDSVSDPVTGGSTIVIGVFPQGEKDIWRLTFDDGASLEVGEDHLWAYRLANHHRLRSKYSVQREFSEDVLGAIFPANRWDRYRVGTTSELMRLFDDEEGIRIPLTAPVLFTVNGRTGTGAVDPYLAGLMLGDGDCNSIRMTSCDDEIREFLLANGFRAHNDLHSDGKPRAYGSIGEPRKLLDAWLRNNGLRHCHSWEKFVPEFVKTSPIDYRLAFLQGLMDTDGTIDERGRCFFTSTSEALALGVQWLARSLGGKARIKPVQPHYDYKGQHLAGRPAWTVRVWHPRQSCLFRLSRKKARATDSWNGGHEITRELVKVEYIGKKEARCIKVSSPYGLYIAEDFIVTHNSETGRAWLAQGNPDVPIAKCQSWDISYLNHPRYRALVLRKNIIDLQDWIDRAREFFTPLGGQLTEKPPVIEFSSGAKIVLGHLAEEAAYEKYQGQEFHRVLIEELTQIESEKLYLNVLASCRSTFWDEKRGVRQLRPQIFCTTNPGGPGNGWVKARFVKLKGKDGKILSPNTVWTNPIDPTLTRVYVPARVADNPFLTNDYVAALKDLPEPQRRAWLDGDWDALAGSYFTDWRPLGPLIGDPENARHVVPHESVVLQPWWPRGIAVDWGFKHNAAVGWYCQHPNGQMHFYRELVVSNVGSEELFAEIARISIPDLRGMPDSQMNLWLSPDAFGKKDDVNTIAQQAEKGLAMILGPESTFLLSETEQEQNGEHFRAGREWQMKKAAIVIRRAQNQRVFGWNHMRTLMNFRDPGINIATAYREEEFIRLAHEEGTSAAFAYRDAMTPKREVRPRFIVHDSCPRIIDAVPTAIYDEGTEDVLKTDAAEDDILDMMRYGAMGYRSETIREPKDVFVANRLAVVGERYPEGLGERRFDIAAKAEEDYGKTSDAGMFTWRRARRNAQGIGRSA